ncbi:MAG: hypothetical protein EP333_09855 [Bacteroidetes bacterium]|nr:MAG: hypothetical protein EP333_09855 [Bacteroidota bacterium]TNE95668.1 MAG: hypothetical protein EP322_09610 [Bacteroidota bacterium]
MNIETSIRYLDFVSQECERHLRDGQVTDDELVNLIIEFQRFQESVNASNLPEEIKSKISQIELNYSIQRVERGTYYMIVAVLTLGSWAIILHMIKQARRKQILNGIKFDASRLSSHIKLNY